MYKEKVGAARAVTLARSHIVQQGLKVRECNIIIVDDRKSVETVFISVTPYTLFEISKAS